MKGKKDMHLGEIRMPAWLSIHRNAEEIMDRIDPIPTAMIPPPDSELPQLPAPESPEVEAMKKAAAIHARIEQERQEQSELIQRSLKEIKRLTSELDWRDLRIAELENNLAVSQSQVETFRQEASDTRALFSSIRAQLDHFEIPLPIRKRRNGARPQEANAA